MFIMRHTLATNIASNPRKTRILLIAHNVHLPRLHSGLAPYLH